MQSKAPKSDRYSTGSTEHSPLSAQEPELSANSFPKIIYRGENNYDTKAASDQATIQQPYGESQTVQSHAEDADINVLMKRYGLTGRMPDDMADRLPTYGDFTEVVDYRTAVEAVNRAHNAFMEVPAELRARFENDPQKFLEYTSDPKNLEEMRKFNLAKPPTEPPKFSHDTQGIIDALKTTNAKTETQPK